MSLFAEVIAPLPTKTDDIVRFMKSNSGMSIFTVAIHHEQTEVTPIDAPQKEDNGKIWANVSRTYYGVVDATDHTIDAGTPVCYTETTQEWVDKQTPRHISRPIEATNCPLYVSYAGVGYPALTYNTQSGTLILDNQVQRIPEQHHAAWYADMKEHLHFFQVLPCPQTNTPAIPLIQAVRQGNEATVHSLLNTQDNINVRDAYGMTALHWAVAEQHTHVIPLLVSAGAAVNSAIIRTPETETKSSLLPGMTTLHTAAEAADETAVRYLVYGGANLHVKDSLGRTPIEYLPPQAAHSLRAFMQEMQALPAVAPSELKNIREWASHAEYILRHRPTQIVTEKAQDSETPEIRVTEVTYAEIHFADGNVKQLPFEACDYPETVEDTSEEALVAYREQIWKECRTKDELVIVFRDYSDSESGISLHPHPECRVHLPYHPIRWQAAMDSMRHAYRQEQAEEAN